MNKAQFYKDTQKFFDDKLIYEIYSTEVYSICNLANTCYGLFLFMDSELGQSGILINPEHVPKIAKNIRFFGKLVNSIGPEQLKERLIFMNDGFYEVLKNQKMKRDIEGLSSDIDLDMEQKLIKKMKKRT